jgi:nucleoside phosphorylase
VPTSSRRGPLVALLALLVAAAGCSSDGGCPSTTAGSASDAPVAVLGAMPSELAPLLARATVDEVQVIDGRVFHVGRLGDARVVLAMTGIGLVNATATAQLLLEHFAVRGVVFSGVAGSPHRIADVTVPLEWSQPDGPVLPADPDWLALARDVADRQPTLERCTPVPPDDPAAELVCLPFAPAIFVSGRGRSSDSYGGKPIVCRPGGGDVFGCDPDLPAAAASSSADDDEVTVDMETAAVAGEAAARGLPFLAFRAVSDGAEDPLGLPGFPSQFFAYYRLAAENAAIATSAFLEALSAADAADAPSCS